MIDLRLLIFGAGCLAFTPVLAPGQQLPVSVLVHSGGSQSSPAWEEYRHSIESIGLKYSVTAGTKPSVTLLGAGGEPVDRYEGDSPAAFLFLRLNLPSTAAKATVNGKRLELSVSADRASGLAGETVVLVLDLKLKPGVHVYAPGVEGYIPIAWALKPSSDWSARPALFPKAEILHLVAIDETVPAYQGHFRLAREVVIAPAAKGPVSIDGTLRYQACDDTMCYIPETLPLHWEIAVR
jgi:hypothetical protein